ncbi:MAG: NADAR family protein [Pseudomonadota bacterium]
MTPTRTVLTDEQIDSPSGYRWRFLAGTDRTWRYTERMPGFDPNIVESQPLYSYPTATLAANAPATPCKYGDPTCPCQDGDACHYEGANPMAAPQADAADASHHKLDTDRQVFFYEQDFYVLSNFSAFTLMWKGQLYDTSEAAYHSEKFAERDLRVRIMHAASAHDAFKFAELWKERRRPDWDDVKVDIMRDILRAKAEQHEYVRRKLLATGDRELVEDSWRDDYLGWGANRDGKNMLGRLWMEVRADLRALSAPTEPAKGDA